jgi:hypothetical protein
MLSTEKDAIQSAKQNKQTLTAKRRANREIAVEFYITIMGDMQALLPLRDCTVYLSDKYDSGRHGPRSRGQGE